jgi:hypothetical protein
MLASAAASADAAVEKIIADPRKAMAVILLTDFLNKTTMFSVI